jgi:hypothetical protein
VNVDGTGLATSAFRRPAGRHIGAGTRTLAHDELWTPDNLFQAIGRRSQ